MCSLTKGHIRPPMTSVRLLNQLSTLYCIYPAVAPMAQGTRFILWNGYIHIETNAALNSSGKNSSAFCFHICRCSMITHTHNVNLWHQQRCICHWNGAGAGAADSSNRPQDTTGSPRHNVLTQLLSLSSVIFFFISSLERPYAKSRAKALPPSFTHSLTPSLPFSFSFSLSLPVPHPYSSHRRQEPLRSNSPETCLDIPWLYPWKPPSVFHVHPPQHIFLKASIRAGSPFCGQTGS